MTSNDRPLRPTTPDPTPTTNNPDASYAAGTRAATKRENGHRAARSGRRTAKVIMGSTAALAVAGSALTIGLQAATAGQTSTTLSQSTGNQIQPTVGPDRASSKVRPKAPARKAKPARYDGDDAAETTRAVRTPGKPKAAPAFVATPAAAVAPTPVPAPAPKPAPQPAPAPAASSGGSGG